MIEFEEEGFKLFRIPKFNKKMRKYLGIPKDDINIIEVAAGFATYNGTRRYIQRTAKIISSSFDSLTGYFFFSTENGKNYKVRYKPEEIDHEAQSQTQQMA